MSPSNQVRGRDACASSTCASRSLDGPAMSACPGYNPGMGDREPRQRRRHRLGDLRQDLRLAARALGPQAGMDGGRGAHAGDRGRRLDPRRRPARPGVSCGRCASRPATSWSRCTCRAAPSTRRCRTPTTPRSGPRSKGTVDLAAFCRVFMTVGGGAFPERHEGEMVSGAFFSVLGVRPALGRLIGPADNVVPGGPRVVVLSDFLWRSQFAADPDIVGRTVRLDEVVYDVVGVTPPGFRGAVWPSFESAFWIPATMADEYFGGRDVLNGRLPVFQTLGRLASGVASGGGPGAHRPGGRGPRPGPGRERLLPGDGGAVARERPARELPAAVARVPGRGRRVPGRPRPHGGGGAGRRVREPRDAAAGAIDGVAARAGDSPGPRRFAGRPGAAARGGGRLAGGGRWARRDCPGRVVERARAPPAP